MEICHSPFASMKRASTALDAAASVLGADRSGHRAWFPLPIRAVLALGSTDMHLSISQDAVATLQIANEVNPFYKTGTAHVCTVQRWSQLQSEPWAGSAIIGAEFVCLVIFLREYSCLLIIGLGYRSGSPRLGSVSSTVYHFQLVWLEGIGERD